MVEVEASAAVGGAAGGVEEAVAECLGGGVLPGAVEADASSPHEEVVGGEAQAHPGVVVDDAVERQLGQTAGFDVAHDAFSASALTVTELCP